MVGRGGAGGREGRWLPVLSLHLPRHGKVGLSPDSKDLDDRTQEIVVDTKRTPPGVSAHALKELIAQGRHGGVHSIANGVCNLCCDCCG